MNDTELLIGQLRSCPSNPNGPSPDNLPHCNELVELINERVRPPIPLTIEDIHIRALRLVSDDINDHGGRFPRDEHERLCELISDTPVLIGHDKSRLPVARNFDARIVAEVERQWVEVLFYWMRGPHGDRLAEDIDGGVIKEGSIGFEFRLPECSVCGRDIRLCEHVPGQEHTDIDGTGTQIHYIYRDITRVLETSLVYRGATPGTHFHTPVCAHNSADCPSGELHAVVLDSRYNSPGLNRYRVALSHSQHAAACDELIIHSTELFDPGDNLTFSTGRWHRDEELKSDTAASDPACTIKSVGSFLLREWYTT